MYIVLYKAYGLSGGLSEGGISQRRVGGGVLGSVWGKGRVLGIRVFGASEEEEGGLGVAFRAAPIFGPASSSEFLGGISYSHYSYSLL